MCIFPFEMAKVLRPVPSVPLGVSLSKPEAMWVNGLPINESCCLWPAHATRVIQSLRAKGQRVVAVPFEVTSSFGGALRCATNPMIRSSDATNSANL